MVAGREMKVLFRETSRLRVFSLDPLQMLSGSAYDFSSAAEQSAGYARRGVEEWTIWSGRCGRWNICGRPGMPHMMISTT